MPENWGKHGRDPGMGLSVEQRALGFNKGNPPPRRLGRGRRGWGARGEAPQPDSSGRRLTDGAALDFTTGCR